MQYSCSSGRSQRAMNATEEEKDVNAPEHQPGLSKGLVPKESIEMGQGYSKARTEPSGETGEDRFSAEIESIPWAASKTNSFRDVTEMNPAIQHLPGNTAHIC